MPTTQEEKPAKPRSRNRKADQKAAKTEAKVQVAPNPVSVEAEPVSAMIAAAIEAAATEAPQAEITPSEVMQSETVQADAAPNDAVPVAVMMEKTAGAAALSGEVLPPESRKVAMQTTSLAAIALAYGDYTQKSWAAGRALVERLIAVRSFEEVIEVQSEFAKQVCADFIAQSQKVCVLYGEWAQQFFKPYEKLAMQWTQAGR